MLDYLVNFFAEYGYAAVFSCLLLCGFGLPVPEDITLVAGGVIAGLYDEINPHTMFLVGIAGVLIGDSTMFLGGRIFGYRVQRLKMFRKILSPRRFSQIQRKFKQYGLGVLFVARFLPGLRSPIFLAAGMSRRISYITFIIMDGMAAMISVPIWSYLGYFFADNRDLLLSYVHDVQSIIYLILGLLLLIVVVLFIKKKLHAKLEKRLGDNAAASISTTTGATGSTSGRTTIGSTGSAGPDTANNSIDSSVSTGTNVSSGSNAGANDCSSSTK